MQIPHRPPFSLVDRLTSITPDEVRAERRVTVDDPLFDGGLPGYLLIDAIAQAAAALNASEKGRHRGFLVALKDVELPAPVRCGDTVTLSARKVATLGALHRFTGEARVGDQVVARGELTFLLEPAA